MKIIKYIANIFLGIFFSFFKNKNLIHQMALREMQMKYKGSMLGVVWAVLTPILMLSVYTFVFTKVFKSRWTGGTGSTTEFAILMFAGLVVFNFFAEVVNRAPRLILDNPNYVKKVVFPLEALAWVGLLSALLNAGISFCVLIVFSIATRGMIPWTALMFPIILFPLILMTVGIAWFFSSLGVFLRDVSQMIGILVSLLMFLSPVFFPSDSLPDNLHLLASLNPLAFYIENTRDLLIWGNFNHMSNYGYHFLFGLFVAFGGLFWFRRTRHAFADVM